MFAFFNQVDENVQPNLVSPAAEPVMKISSADAQTVLSFLNKKDSADVMVMIMKDSVNIRPTRVLRRGRIFPYFVRNALNNLIFLKSIKSLNFFKINKYCKLFLIFFDLFFVFFVSV